MDKLSPKSLEQNLTGKPRNSGFTLVELLVVIAIISIIAGFLVPTLLRGRAEALKVQCANNLKEVGKMAVIYADSAGKNFFPFGKGGNPTAAESLNQMVKFNKTARKLDPRLFRCPEWRYDEAEPDDNDRYELDEFTLSYTWTSRRLSTTDQGYALSSDKYMKSEEVDVDELRGGHDSGLNVLYTDIHVEWKNDTDKELEDSEDMLPKGLVR